MPSSESRYRRRGRHFVDHKKAAYKMYIRKALQKGLTLLNSYHICLGGKSGLAAIGGKERA